MSVSAVFQKEGGSKADLAPSLRLVHLCIHGIVVHPVERFHGEVRRVAPDENQTGGVLENMGTLQRSEHRHGEHHWPEHVHDSKQVIVYMQVSV